MLVNALGGGAWSTDDNVARPIHERPLWKCGAAIVGEQIAPCPVLGNPGAFWRVGHLAQTADLAQELEQFALLWGRDDRVIPAASFDAIRTALTNLPVVTVREPTVG